MKLTCDCCGCDIEEYVRILDKDDPADCDETKYCESCASRLRGIFAIDSWPLEEGEGYIRALR